MPKSGSTDPKPNQPKADHKPVSPTPPDCRAVRITGTDIMAICASPQKYCKHRFTYADTHYCRSPEREAVIRRSQTAQ